MSNQTLSPLRSVFLWCLRCWQKELCVALILGQPSLNANDFRIESSRSDLSCVPEELSFFLLRKTSKTTSLGIMEMLEFWAASTCEELHGPWAREMIFLRLVNCSGSGSMSLFPFKTNGSYHFDPRTALRISWWVIKLFYKNAIWTNTESFCN